MSADGQECLAILATMTDLEQHRLSVIVHVVHEYANFVSSAEMLLSGCDIDGVPFKPPINTHISHAFYLNCRKLADLFQNKVGPDKDDIMSEHYVPGFYAPLQPTTRQTTSVAPRRQSVKVHTWRAAARTPLATGKLRNTASGITFCLSRSRSSNFLNSAPSVFIG